MPEQGTGVGVPAAATPMPAQKPATPTERMDAMEAELAEIERQIAMVNGMLAAYLQRLRNQKKWKEQLPALEPTKQQRRAAYYHIEFPTELDALKAANLLLRHGINADVEDTTVHVPITAKDHAINLLNMENFMLEQEKEPFKR